MEHAEKIYLIERARLILGMAEKAAARGEVFHALPVFSPLKVGLEAYAQILPVRDDVSDLSLVLRLRHPVGQTLDQEVLTTFHQFFDGKGSVVPSFVVEKGQQIYAAFGPIPPPLRPPSTP